MVRATPEFKSDAWHSAETASDSTSLLRFSTAGSVDDGKSTLIGRLLYDSQAVYDDQLASIRQSRIKRSPGPIDFSLLTDGLRAEREQGITIDVAYRYFSTPRRKFIIADTPGHEQYTRNMATGASTADAAVVLVDAAKGLLHQSRRHAYIASLLGVRHVIAAVNKMDLVGRSEVIFNRIAGEFGELAQQLGMQSVQAVPVSALQGDNVVRRSAHMSWYDGPTLLEYLERIPANHSAHAAPLRFPVQYVIRPDASFRGFAGQVASGALRKGTLVVAVPSGIQTRIRSIVSFEGEKEQAQAGDSVTVTLEDEIDLSRGDLLASAEESPSVASAFRAAVVWMHSDWLDAGKHYLLKQTTRTVRARVATVHRIDVDSLGSISASSLALNDIGVVDVRTSQPLFVEAYRENRATGSFILIDPMTNATVGAGIIQRVLSLDRGRPSCTFALRAGAVTPRERRVRFGHAPALVWLPRRSVAELVERTLFEDGWNVHLLADGDFGAHGLTTVAKALHRAGVVVLFSGAEWPVEKIQAISGLGSFLKFDARERDSGEGSDDAQARRIVEELRRWRDQNPECGDDE